MATSKTYPVTLHHPRIVGVTATALTAAAEESWREAGWLVKPPRNPAGVADVPAAEDRAALPAAHDTTAAH